MNGDQENAADEILSYLDKHGVVDKDASGNVPEQKSSGGGKVKAHKGQFRTVLDLHGMTSGVAERKIRSTLADCRSKGINELLIIHGRGFHSQPSDRTAQTESYHETTLPVLKKLVRDLLENELKTIVRNYRTALPRDGGEGATVVVLK